MILAVEPEVIDLFKQFYGWLYFQYLKLRWRRLRRMSADEYVEAVKRGRIDGG